MWVCVYVRARAFTKNTNSRLHYECTSDISRSETISKNASLKKNKNPKLIKKINKLSLRKNLLKKARNSKNMLSDKSMRQVLSVSVHLQ